MNPKEVGSKYTAVLPWESDKGVALVIGLPLMMRWGRYSLNCTGMKRMYRHTVNDG